MRRCEVEAVFCLAGIEVFSLTPIPNEYWAEDKLRSPWWIVLTPHGPIKLGWRKRVVSVSWDETPVRAMVTKENVTKSDTDVHAWSTAKLVEYLTTWHVIAERQADAYRKRGWTPS